MEDAKPRLWYDKTQPKLVAAAEKLRRNVTYAACIARFDAWADRILHPWRMVLVIGLPLAAIRAAFGYYATLGTLISLLACVGFYYVVKRVVRRCVKNLPQAIRRGTYGFAAMWDFDAEWQKLAEALTVLELNLDELMATHPGLIREPITKYLTDKEVVKARRAVRTGNKNDIDPQQAAVTLSSKARDTAIEIERLLQTQ